MGDYRAECGSARAECRAESPSARARPRACVRQLVAMRRPTVGERVAPSDASRRPVGAGRERQGMPLLRQTHAATATATATAAARVARVTHLRIAGISRFLAGGSTAQSRKTAACTARRGEAAAAAAAATARSESSSGATTRAWPAHRPATRYMPVFPNLASAAIYLLT